MSLAWVPEERVAPLWFEEPERDQRLPVECPNCGAPVHPPQVIFPEWESWRMAELRAVAMDARDWARRNPDRCPF